MSVQPLKSTRSDVEKLFSELTTEKEFVDDGVRTVFYTDRSGKFTVDYSVGTCAGVYESNYLADRDTVLRIIYFPKVQPPFSKFKLDKKDFSKTMEGDDPDWHYVSPKLGFDYGVQLGRVDFVERVPPGDSSKICK